MCACVCVCSNNNQRGKKATNLKGKGEEGNNVIIIKSFLKEFLSVEAVEAKEDKWHLLKNENILYK